MVPYGNTWHHRRLSEPTLIHTYMYTLTPLLDILTLSCIVSVLCKKYVLHLRVVYWWIIGGLVWELFSGLRILNLCQSSRLGVVFRFANFKLEPVVCLSFHKVWHMFNRGNYTNKCNVVLYWNLSKDATEFWLLIFWIRETNVHVNR